MPINQLKLKKTLSQKNMKLGNKKLIFYISFFILMNLYSVAEEKILSNPLLNLEKLKPSFEEVEEFTEDKNANEIILEKKITTTKSNSLNATLIGLDKITAKTSKIIVKLGEVKNFGPLEIKLLKCSKLNSKIDNQNSVAYIQVKDLSGNQNEQVFIFNGWTFSSDPTIAPFDHAIYDLQLVNCNNA